MMHVVWSALGGRDPGRPSRVRPAQVKLCAASGALATRSGRSAFAGRGLGQGRAGRRRARAAHVRRSVRPLKVFGGQGWRPGREPNRRAGKTVGGYAAGVSSSRSGSVWVKPGCQRRKSSARSLLRTRVRTWSSRCAPRGGPAHLLLFDHALADHLVDRGLREGAGDGLARPVALAVVGDGPRVGPEVGVELGDSLEQPDLRKVESIAVEVEDQVADDLQRPEHVAVPEQPLETLELLADLGGESTATPAGGGRAVGLGGSWPCWP